ncbi:MAG: hypothetical protein LBF16_04445 [Pseudomonadales bacterium]|nr:hypothetical protein [Pseudomonadales bacterium]
MSAEYLIFLALLILIFFQFIYFKIIKINHLDLGSKIKTREYFFNNSFDIYRLMAILSSISVLAYFSQTLGLPFGGVIITNQILWILSRQWKFEDQALPQRSLKKFLYHLTIEAFIFNLSAIVIGYAILKFQ